MLARCNYSAAVEHYNHIRIHHRRDALRYDYLCCFGDKAGKAVANERVGLGVDRARRVVENKYLRLAEQRAGNADTLLLTAGNIRSSLLYMSVVAVRERLDKFMRLRETARLDKLLIGR